MKDVLTPMTRYNQWANQQLVETVAKHAIDQLDTEVASSFNTLRKTLAHIGGAEIVWMKRLHGESLNGLPSIAATQSFDELKAALSKVDTDFVSYVAEHAAAHYDELCHYTNLKGEPFDSQRGWMILHCMNHSTFHRGQVVTILRTLGVTAIPATDLIHYLRVGVAA